MRTHALEKSTILVCRGARLNVQFTSASVYLSPATNVSVRFVLCGAAKVLSLKNNGISACLVGGSSDLRTEEKAIAGEFPLVFVTPEKVPS